jgi:hypothetical protein
MAEGLIGGILGGEDEKPEVEASDTPAVADSFVATIAHHASIQNPELVRDTSAFLRGQLRPTGQLRVITQGISGRMWT